MGVGTDSTLTFFSALVSSGSRIGPSLATAWAQSSAADRAVNEAKRKNLTHSACSGRRLEIRLRSPMGCAQETAARPRTASPNLHAPVPRRRPSAIIRSCSGQRRCRPSGRHFALVVDPTKRQHQHELDHALAQDLQDRRPQEDRVLIIMGDPNHGVSIVRRHRVEERSADYISGPLQQHGDMRRLRKCSCSR